MGAFAVGTVAAVIAAAAVAAVVAVIIATYEALSRRMGGAR